MSSQGVLIDASCAVEVFLATAILHQEKPERRDFTIQEIVNRAAKENVTGEMRSGVNVHASQHCVANRAPNPAKHRMLFATGKHTRRLLMPGDEVHPGRTGKIFPEQSEIPERYLPLLEWAKQRYEHGLGDARQWSHDSAEAFHPMSGGSIVAGRSTVGDVAKEQPRPLEGLLQARGIGAHLAGDTDPDDYIRELRAGWE
jgi:hypothetical protein